MGFEAVQRELRTDSGRNGKKKAVGKERRENGRKKTERRKMKIGK